MSINALLTILQKKANQVTVASYESLPPRSGEESYQFTVDCTAESNDQLNSAIQQIKQLSTYIHILDRDDSNLEPDNSSSLKKTENFNYQEIS
jgi:prephenate dehydratase